MSMQSHHSYREVAITNLCAEYLFLICIQMALLSDMGLIDLECIIDKVDDIYTAVMFLMFNPVLIAMYIYALR